jgi:hypothetical protein
MGEHAIDWLLGSGAAWLLLAALCFATSHSEFIYVDF